MNGEIMEQEKSGGNLESCVRSDRMDAGPDRKTTYDDVLVIVGEFGPYHKYAFILMLLVNIYTAFPIMMVVFLYLDVPFRCSVPGLDNDTFHIQDETHQRLVNTSIPYDVTIGLYSQCYSYSRENIDDGDNSTIPCDRWVFDPDYASSSLVATLNLVCDHRHIKTQFTMVMTLGLLVASIVAGPAADTFGRKRPVIISLLISSVAIVIQTSIVNIPAMLFLGCVISGANMSAYLTSFTLLIELFDQSKRPMAGVCIMIGWSSGLVLTSPFFYVISDCKIESYVIAGIGFCFIFHFWAVQESPRWLLARNKVDDAKKIFRDMARVNKVKLPEDLEFTSMVKPVEEDGKAKTEIPLRDLKSILTNRVLRLRVLVLSFVWFSQCVTYAYSTYSVAELIEGDVYVNSAIQAIMESLGFFTAFVLTRYFGRRTLISGFMALSGVSYLVSALSVLLDIGTSWIPITLYAVGKFGITGAYLLMLTVTNEIMPTVVRNSAVGICVCVGQVSSVMSPYLALVETVIPGNFGKALPTFIFGALTSTSAVLTLLLPETKNRKLPDTIEEAKNLGRIDQTKQVKPKGQTPSDGRNMEEIAI